MNWDAIAAIGQMLGSVAVFVTLGYLGAGAALLLKFRIVRPSLRRYRNSSALCLVQKYLARRHRWFTRCAVRACTRRGAAHSGKSPLNQRYRVASDATLTRSALATRRRASLHKVRRTPKKRRVHLHKSRGTIGHLRRLP